MDETITIKSINAECGKCGTINRIDLEHAYIKASKCGMCGQQLTTPEQMHADETTSSIEPSVGFWKSFLLVSFILVITRYSLDLIDDSDLRKIAIVLLVIIAATFKSLRAITLKAAIVLFIFSAIFFSATNWSELKKHRISPSEAVSQIWHIFSGYGPIKDFRRQISADKYQRYVEAVDVRDEEINILASRITEICASNDKGCEAKAIAEYVSTQINYRSDPISGPDYIKSVHLTLKSGAGDCDDKTVLASSLLGTIGIPSHLVFEKHHAYLRACFQSKVSNKYLDSSMVTRIRDQYCYDLEPTAKWSGLGVDMHNKSKIQAIIDVKTKTRID